MLIKALAVRDALTDRLVRVSSDQHPGDIPWVADSVYAVFDGDENGPFLGLVNEQHITQFPQRIFADLIPRPAPAPVTEDTPLESLEVLLKEAYSAVPVVDAGGVFLGAVTLTSLFTRLLDWQRAAQRETSLLLEENRRLTQRLFASQEQISRYVAHELHDEMGQYCTAVQANIQTVIELNKGADRQVHEHCMAALDICDHVHETMQTLLRRLRPVLLDEIGLGPALQELVSTWRQTHAAVECRVDIEGEVDSLDDELNIAIFRITQECLTNIARHAEATAVLLRLHRQVMAGDNPGDGAAGRNHPEDRISLTIKDNGKGFSEAAVSKGLGLTGVRERVFGLGGVLSIDSTPHRGTTIEIQLPVGQAA